MNINTKMKIILEFAYQIVNKDLLTIIIVFTNVQIIRNIMLIISAFNHAEIHIQILSSIIIQPNV